MIIATTGYRHTLCALNERATGELAGPSLEAALQKDGSDVPNNDRDIDIVISCAGLEPILAQAAVNPPSFRECYHVRIDYDSKRPG